MKWFSFFKKKEQQVSLISPGEELQYIIDYIPEFYKDQRQYINAREFLNNHEWGLSLESLLELAGETGHYFSEGFWNRLADLAGQLNLSESKAYCLKQIKRNKRDLKFLTSFGSTVVKIDDYHFQHYIPEKQKQEWLTKRHKKDNVEALLKKEGVYLKMDGRSGTVYIVDRGKLAEVYVELGMKALILSFRATTDWILPVKQPLTESERLKIKDMINLWAFENKAAIEIEE